jgi:hypothetical protein
MNVFPMNRPVRRSAALVPPRLRKEVDYVLISEAQLANATTKAAIWSWSRC